MGGARLKIHDSLSGYEENRLVRTKTFSAHNKGSGGKPCV